MGHTHYESDCKSKKWQKILEAENEPEMSNDNWVAATFTRDTVGQSIQAGDVVVYTNKRGSSTHVSKSIVREVQVKNELDYYTEEPVTKTRLKVRTIKSPWGEEPLQLINKDTYVENPSFKTVKVNFFDVDPRLQRVFDPIRLQILGGGNNGS